MFAVGLIIICLVVFGATFPLWGGIIKQEVNAFLRTGFRKTDDETVNIMPVSVRWSSKNTQIAYLYLAGWIIRKNTNDPKEKIQFIKSYFIREFGQFNAENQAELVNAMKYNTNIRSVADWILHHLKDGSQRTKIIDFLFDVARIDGKIIDREFVAIVRLSELIGVRAAYLDKKMKEFTEQQFRSYQSQSGRSTSSSTRAKHLLVLQLSENFTEEQLKRAYRKMAKKYHPDKQIHRSAEEKNRAHQKFLEVQEAYDYFVSLN